MPLYSYLCKKCSSEWEAVNSITDRKEEKCPCGHNASLVFKGSNVNVGDFYNRYFDDGLGCRVDSKQHRNKLMKEKNLVDIG